MNIVMEYYVLIRNRGFGDLKKPTGTMENKRNRRTSLRLGLGLGLGLSSFFFEIIRTETRVWPGLT